MKQLFKHIVTLSFLCLASVSLAQAPAYYYQGRHKVQVEVRTDALAVETSQPVSAIKSRVRAGIPAARMETAAGLVNKAIIVTAARDLNELNQQAAKVRRMVPGARVQAILRAREASASAPAKTLTDSISFKLPAGKPLQAIINRYKLHDVKPVDFAENTYTARVDSGANLLAALHTANTMQESGEAEWAAPLVEQQKFKREIPNDPLFPGQWHLQNNGTNTSAGLTGNDLNVVPAWEIATGSGINIAIPDDGVETTHSDLMANIKGLLDHDFNDNDDDPGPLPTESHGTACAGVAAGKGNNGIGISGVAPDAGIIGLRLLSEPISDAQEAGALAWRYDDPDPATRVAVNSNSWGPNDDGRTLGGPGPMSEAALQAGTTQGRGQKGIVYVWAAGNGGGSNDNINKDGYASSPYVIAVGATNSTGTSTYYSEQGAPMLVNTPSSHLVDAILTTDITGPTGSSSGDYFSKFGGTSAAAPAAAGVVALMLEANPDLTYRDVMHILVNTATQNDPTYESWYTNGAGHVHSHDYGFGRINAEAAVSAAQSWKNVPAPAPVVTVHQDFQTSVAIPDNNPNGALLEIPVTAPANFAMEHVELETDIEHTYRGDLLLFLQSPSGMISELMWPSNDPGDDYDHWRFRSVAHWDENPTGNWRLLVSDLYAGDTGYLKSLTLRLMGYEREQSSAELWHLY